MQLLHMAEWEAGARWCRQGKVAEAGDGVAGSTRTIHCDKQVSPCEGGIVDFVHLSRRKCGVLLSRDPCKVDYTQRGIAWYRTVRKAEGAPRIRSYDGRRRFSVGRSESP